MVNKRDLGLLLLLFLLSRANGGAAAPAPAVPSGAGTDPDEDARMLQPGVYWYCCGASEARDMFDWLNARTLMVDSVKLLGSNGIDCAIVLFKLNGVGFWTPMLGIPRLAPYGLDTTLEHLKQEPTLSEWFLKKAQQAAGAVLEMDRRIQQWIDSLLR